MPTALVFMPDGVEAMSFTISVDILRRSGITVTVAGINGKIPHVSSQSVKIMPDMSLQDAVTFAPYDIVICPGGLPAREILNANALVGQMLHEQEKRNGYIGAICAGVTVLKSHNIGEGKKATCYPTEVDKIKDYFQYQEDERVVVDGKLITSKGGSTGFDFGLAIAEILQSSKVADTIRSSLLL